MTEVGLRERKKDETRRTIAEVALELAVERGPDAVTVEEIAAAANVSPRTVFNHFGTKDEAILGIDPGRRAELVAEVVDRPAREAPLHALCGVLTEIVCGGEEPARYWLARAELVRDHPHLRSAQMASQVALEHDLAEAIAARTGLDVARDLYPSVLVTTVMAALRLVLARVVDGDTEALRHDIEATFRQLADGHLPPLPRQGTA
jgi:AcrR family transcriptional regulator